MVGEAANGQEALDQISLVRPDLILLDLEMPVMDGTTFIRHSRLRSPAKIVILSSIITPGADLVEEARMRRVDAVVTKPSGAVSFDLESQRGKALRQAIYLTLGIGR